MSVATVRVPLGPRSYEVRIGAGLIDAAGDEIAGLLARPRVFVVTEERVAEAHLGALRAGLGAGGVEARALVLPAGEPTKSWDGLRRAVDWLLDEGVARDDLVVAFGGGVVGDLAGFAAAILRRGVALVQIPTTLLAQVDSSVGGKTGINAARGKNLIGAFHQPARVLADIDCLATLPDRDFRAGYAEVAKYGALGDADFFAWLEARGPGLRTAPDDLAEAVRRSVEAKAQIVGRDETEAGDRALLNLGHTFGHALEAATGYSDRLLHGEGVAIGMALAFDLSARMGLCAARDAGRLRAHLARMGLPTDIGARTPAHDARALLALMAEDKKVRAGRLRFVLVRGIGRAFVTAAVDPDDVAEILTASRERPAA